jgi:hypothetical protein
MPQTSGREILSTLSRELTSPEFAELVPRLSWSQHTEILAAIRITRELGWSFASLRIAGAGRFVLQGPAPGRCRLAIGASRPGVEHVALGRGAAVTFGV